jgi:hypothetical protein
MITVAINTVPVSPHRHIYDNGAAAELARIASEIAERIQEMNELKFGSGTDLVRRLASVARVDVGAFSLIVAVLHGQVESILDSYAVKGERAGREKQTMHYRLLRELDTLHEVFPEAALVLNRIRDSVKHHEDPQSCADTVREAMR